MKAFNIVSNPFSNTFDELIFENRNKSYGAYYLRKVQDEFMVRGMMFGISLLIFLIIGPRLLHSNTAENEIIIEDTGCAVTLEKLPNVERPLPPPARAKLPEIKPTIRFVEPIVVKDNTSITEEIPPTIVEIGGSVISNETTQGNENGVNHPLLVPVPTEAPLVKNKVKVEPNVEEDPILNISSEKPSFPEGMSALMKYLSKNINYPSIARESGIEGKVIVQFVVSNDGSIQMATVLRGIGGGCDEEALRVVKQMPNWNPGRNNGKAVKVRFTLPINFKLQ